MNPHWMIDNTVDLTAICEGEAWHLASAERALIAQGIARRDAEAFVDFAFHVSAAVVDRCPPELTPQQFARLTVKE